MWFQCFVYGTLESVSVLWCHRNYQWIIIIFKCNKTDDKNYVYNEYNICNRFEEYSHSITDKWQKISGTINAPGQYIPVICSRCGMEISAYFWITKPHRVFISLFPSLSDRMLSVNSDSHCLDVRNSRSRVEGYCEFVHMKTIHWMDTKMN